MSHFSLNHLSPVVVAVQGSNEENMQHRQQTAQFRVITAKACNTVIIIQLCA